MADLLDGPTHCVVAEVACRYHSSLAFPDRVAVGIRVAQLGRTSVRYEIGVFRNDDDVAAAEGHFVHVFVERATQRPARGAGSRAGGAGAVRGLTPTPCHCEARSDRGISRRELAQAALALIERTSMGIASSLRFSQ